MSAAGGAESAVRLYLSEQRAIIDAFPVAAVAAVADALFQTYDRGGQVYALGNGGNAGTLDHAYADFRLHPFVSEDKTRPVPASVPRLHFVNLCASAAELTALANDMGVEHMYTAALEPLVTADDLVMAYSGSGNSLNVVRALEVAAAVGARTFAMTRNGDSRCQELADICLVVTGMSRFPGQTGANNNNFHFEDAILSVNHMLVGLLKQRIAASL